MKIKKEFVTGVVTGIFSVFLLLAVLTNIVLIKYEDTAISIFVLAKNAVLGPTKKISEEAVSGEAVTGDTKEVFSSVEVAAKLDMLNSYIEQYYLGEGDVTREKEAAYKALVEALGDPYSEYYTAEEYRKQNEKYEGSYIGIGITLAMNRETGQFSVDDVQVGGGAEEAGIKPGDILYTVAGSAVEGMDLEELINIVRGEEGSTVDIEVFRSGKDALLSFTVERRDVQIQTVEYELLEGKIGYIHLTRFSQNTTEQFRDAVNALEGQGVKGLIVDLRDNGGGSLSAVVEVLDQILPKGLLVYTKTKNGKEKEYYSTDKERFEKPLCVIINENSASASEIFAGAIKDRNAGTLVGRTSFGKGIVQKVYVLDDGSAVKLTNSEYFTPNGNNIHGVGIEPNIEVEQVEETEEDEQLAAAIRDIEAQIGAE